MIESYSFPPRVSTLLRQRANRGKFLARPLVLAEQHPDFPATEQGPQTRGGWGLQFQHTSEVIERRGVGVQLRRAVPGQEKVRDRVFAGVCVERQSQLSS